jgi:mRNA-degrading endonuclease RelE of RelBE toxin-antitoxin system
MATDHDHYRIRQDPYRIIYKIQDNVPAITKGEVSHRCQAYR